ncbi:HoxN/HupN/NixA family nickel/cobalt transporter [Francisella frigiditurris]|uniref:Nickel/cobalt efflux system n=1 Tax=Francisella frigiditurris TaxID=1542390 RepID=A0A1J0KS05_9GAMM|nr:metal transporter [Francisella frigiditurris]APC96404.1 high-affinity nickel-transport family protein [Francisella frigiditurris]
MISKVSTKLFFVLISLIGVVFLFTVSSNVGILGTIAIAFMLGLRHGFDADHIVAIDNVTRQLVNENKASFKTGLFFALGHSTIVFLLTLFIALGFSFSHMENASFLNIGAVFGTLMSVCFLFITGSMSLISLTKLISADSSEVHGHQHQATSLLSKLFRPIVKTIDRPYKMYFVGFLFGLGFDTATEVALLGMAAVSAINNLSIWYIMLLPIAFATGMIIVDSVDAAMMSKVLNLNIKENKYKNYNIIVLCIVVVAAYIIALVEMFSLFSVDSVKVNEILGFFDENSSAIGLSIVIIFLILFFMKISYQKVKH